VKKYEVREATPEELQKFHEERPIVIFEDGQPGKFCHDQDEADELKREAEGYQVVEEKLEQLVRDVYSNSDLVDYEIWEMIHEISQGPPREM